MNQKTLFWIGYSESLYKSTVVKSLRMGWPAGLEEASRHLTKSTMTALLMCGLFEDTFPLPSELEECIAEVHRRDYEALCRRETLHGRGYAQALFDFKEESVAAAQNERGRLYAEARALGLAIPPRALNCLYTWLKIEPGRSGRRTTDATRWTTMPLAMADGHTLEGRRANRKMTVLSGHYPNHLALGERVMREGWNGIRAEVHSQAFDLAS
jgi:hypothetical protein